MMLYILVQVVRRFDACLRKLTTKLKGTAFLKIGNHDYKLNSLIEHHSETRGHYKKMFFYLIVYYMDYYIA